MPAYLLLDDGRLHISAQVHRGEDPQDVEAVLELAGFACVVEVVSTFSDYPGLEHAPRSVEIYLGGSGPGGIDGTCAKDVLAWLSCAEAVEAIAARPQARPLVDESNWYVQTSIPDPPGGHDLDVSARLFANGVTGRGQVIAVADSGLDNDACFFTYGPNNSDATLFLPDATYPPPVAATSHGRSDGQSPQIPDPHWRPDNKVVAYYWPGSSPLPGCYGPYDVGFPHGTAVAGAACGDDPRVLAAKAGSERDDAFEDEADPDDFGTLIDHHQSADGVAPGAQLIIQETPSEGFGVSPTLLKLIEQAYDTEPGARVHTNSSGLCGNGGQGPPPTGADEYGPGAIEVDYEMFRLRDMLVTIAAGNSGPGYGRLTQTSASKSCLSVGATKRGNDGPGGVAIDMMTGLPTGGSGHGPGFPNRIKPDLAVPGQGLGLPWSSCGDRGGDCSLYFGCFVDDEPGHVSSGDGGCPTMSDPDNTTGTSFATPQVAGMAMLVRQYFTDGYYPSGAPDGGSGFIPTNALLKAILINSTRNLTGSGTGDIGSIPEPRPTFGQGWGPATVTPPHRGEM